MFKTFNFFHLSSKASVSIEKVIKKRGIELIFDFSGKFKLAFFNLRNPFPVVVNAEVRRILDIFKHDKHDSFSPVGYYRTIEYLKFLNLIERSIEEDLSIAVIGCSENRECRFLIESLNRDLQQRGYKTRVDNL